MGTCIRNLSDGAVLVAADDTWIEGKAIQQLETTARLGGMHRVAGMPDLHPGRGYPVGAAFFSVGRLYPALVGNDIGCGMALWRTDIPTAKLHLDKLEKRLGNLDLPLDETWQEAVASFGLPATGHERSLGTIGGGNHFAELQQLDESYDDTALAALGIERKHLLLLVHSGSRGLGEAILREQVDLFGHHGLEAGSEASTHYLGRHDGALRFAEANRQLIARRMLDRLRADGDVLLDINHNLVSPAQVDGLDGWLHRKGATPSDQGGGGDPWFARRLQLLGTADRRRAQPVVPGPWCRTQMDAQRVQGPPRLALQRRATESYGTGQPRDLRRPGADLRGSAGGLQVYRLGGGGLA